MTLEIGLSQTPWKLVPSSKAEEIAQCVKCLLLTAKGTCFFYRDFGVNTELIDKPLPVAKNRFLAEVVKQVAKYESRARVKGVRWITDEASDGVLAPVVTIELRE
ncbi:MAG: hypothetical protein IKI76_02990 [Selenomonadaceae bacterium]|nr:hypothetical protein [Selenomonadaceae bacterium]